MTTQNSDPNSDSNNAVVRSTEPDDYTIVISDSLKEAWQRTSGLKGSFWAAAALVFIIMLIAGFIISALANIMGMGGTTILVQLLIQIAVMALIYPFMAGIFMLGVRRAVDLPISYNEAFAYFAFVVPLVVAAVLMGLLMTIGFILLIIPGIYLAVAYMFTVPLIVDKNLSAWRAMETSRRAVTRHWFKFFAILLIMTLILFISVIPLGIGLIWSYPMLIAMLGILYRDTFGVQQAE